VEKEKIGKEEAVEEKSEPQTLFYNMYAMKCLLAFSVDNGLQVQHYITYSPETTKYDVSFAGVHPKALKPVWARNFEVSPDMLTKTMNSVYRILTFYESKGAKNKK